MKIVVKKFGGTSVGDIKRIRNVALLLQKFKQQNPDTHLIVVVSAMSGETNKLIALAKSCVKQPAPRELDALVSTGEQVTVALLSMALIELGIPAKSFTGSQARIATDTVFTDAKILDIDTKDILDSVEQGEIPVVTGFQGIDPEGNITTLGRGGSDITAVAVAAAVKASACYIYTDVEGVLSADPRICSTAKVIPRIAHEEMLELASQGAKVLHPRSVFFAMVYHVPLVVLSTFNPEGSATWVVQEEELMEKPVVSGVTYRLDDAKITVQRFPGGIVSLNKIFQALSKEHIFIDMITQSASEDGAMSVSFTVPEETSSRALQIVQGLTPSLKAEGAYIERDITKVSVVGIGMAYHTGVAATLFAALAAEKIEVQMITTSEIKISVVIARKYCEVAVNCLHQAFIEMNPRVSQEATAQLTHSAQA